MKFFLKKNSKTKEKFLIEKITNLQAAPPSLKKTYTDSTYNLASKFQPYIPINKNLLKKYKERHNNINKEDVYFKNSQKFNLKKSPLNVKTPNNSNITNVSHIKKRYVNGNGNFLKIKIQRYFELNQFNIAVKIQAEGKHPEPA